MEALRVCWVLLGTLAAGSAQLLFENIPSVTMDACNTTVLIPCKVNNLIENNATKMFVKWKLQGKVFLSYDGVDNIFVRNRTFESASLNVPDLPSGNASLLLSKHEAIPGNYSCEVVEASREGQTLIELIYVSATWFRPVEHGVITAFIILGNILYWAQFGVVAKMYDMTFSKKIGLGIPGIIATGFAVIGCILFAADGYASGNQAGLGLIILPAVILVPLFYFLFTSVFEKQPLFAIILVVLKALGYVIAVVGFALCVSACRPKQSSVVIAGLVIIDIVAAIGLIYIIVLGFNLKDHQPPRVPK
ncbi:leukocyte surface antigen CD47 isoform X2 [Elgaria multicarinata webbii]|uniref:leukocyte surface antigen CD47 isoform X2 n=1 Tax=Elgaria multicarinata webbii TaxID=159646 RepID=UPI002FCD4EF5